MRYVTLCLIGLAMTSVSLGDTLVCDDGRRLVGEVTRTADGYTVQLKLGRTFVPDTQVVEWIKGDGPQITPVPQTAPAPQTAPVKPPAATKPATVAGNRNLERLIAQGQEALAAGDFKAAHDIFLDALTSDNNSVRALHGLGLSYIGSGNPERAVDLLERATRQANPPDRALVLNTSAVYISTHSSAKAIALLTRHLSAHAGDNDEAVLNALAIAIANADVQTRATPAFAQAEQAYAAANAKLEQTRPGEKRWGLQWQPAAEVDAKMRQMTGGKAEAQKLAEELAALDQRIAQTRQELELNKDNKTPGGQLRQIGLEADLQKFQAHRSVQEQKQRELSASAVSPEWPRQLTTVAMDEVGPGKVDHPAVAVVPDPPPATSPVKPPVRPPATRLAMADPPRVVVRPPQGNKKQKVTRYGAAFPVGADLLVTAAGPLQDAAEIKLQGPDGVPFDATVVKKDARSGLALLRASSRKLPYFEVEDSFDGGAVQCPAYSEVDLFEPKAQLVAGQAGPANGAATISFAKHPRLPGSPVLANGKVVGVELADRDSQLTKIPSATLAQLKQLCGDQGGGGAPKVVGDPCGHVYQLIVTAEPK